MEPARQQFIEQAEDLLVRIDALEQEADNADTKETYLKIRHDLSGIILEMNGLYTAFEDGDIFFEECRQLESYINEPKSAFYNKRKELLKGYKSILLQFIKYNKTYKP